MKLRAFLLSLCAVLVLTACVTRPTVEIRSYLLAPPWPTTSSARPVLDLRVAPFDVAPQFEGKPLVYRFSEVRYEADFYNEFLVTPRIMLMERSAEWLRHAGWRVAATSPAPYVIRATVPALYGDFRDPAQPRAVLDTRLSLWRTGEDTPLIVRGYHYSVPIPDSSADSVVQGLSQALAQTLEQWQNELHSLTTERGTVQ